MFLGTPQEPRQPKSPSPSTDNKQQHEGPLTEDPSTQDSHHDHGLGTPEVSRALRARNLKRVRKGCPAPGSPRVRKESKNAASDSFWTLFGLRGALFGDSGAPWGGTPFSDSFRTLLGFRARRARETSVPGRGVPKP